MLVSILMSASSLAIGWAAGDALQFVGYGAGATLHNVDATHWQGNYNGGTAHDVIAFSAGWMVTVPPLGRHNSHRRRWVASSWLPRRKYAECGYGPGDPTGYEVMQ